MPPEQARGKPDEIDARTDIFAVGAVMFRALSGRFVHDLPRSDDRLFAAMKNVAPPLRSALPNAPNEIAQIVDRALQFERDGRWPTAAMMRLAVRSAYPSLKEQARRKTDGSEDIEDVDIESFVEDDPSSIVVEVSFGTVYSNPSS